MTYPLHQRELTVQLDNGDWQVSAIEGTDILGPIDHGWQRYTLDPDSFTFGEGLLAGSSIPGSRRLFFCAWSPQWQGFYVSSMGGAAYTFHGLGVNYVSLRGRCGTPSVLILNHREGGLEIRLEPVDVDAVWSGGAESGGRHLIGFYALQQILFNRYAEEYPSDRARIFALGPAARVTREGAIGSNTVRRGELTAVVDWAGRGGLGSRLLHRHNLVGCVFGGSWEDPDLPVSAEIDGYFLKHFGQKAIKADLAMTEKYRYFPKFDTGGTFGVNMQEVGDRILSFNYRSIYASAEERSEQHRSFVLDHYLKQFNAETIKTKSFKHCGEPCAVSCKKMNGSYKKDFEPYHALGPQVGVFDQRAAELLNDHVDAMGFDAIQTGGTLAWLMELVADGLIPPEDFGFPSASELSFRFASDPKAFDLVADSMRNARYAMAVVDAIIGDERCAPIRDGMRAAAKALDQRYGTATVDRTVCLAHGDGGYMVPNQYWVPGMGSPMPMMGKYYVYYGPEFLTPEQLGRKNVERMTYELVNDNGGICRFHRKWAELITGEIIQAHYDITVDYKAQQFALAQAIHAREGAKSRPWEGERIADLLVGFLEHWRANGLQDPEFDKWLARFRQDKRAATVEFWQAMKRGQDEAFARGPEAIPTLTAPHHAPSNPSA
jgi:glyceraldehyde-3-phosphate dehydrogenase (ferredoxin)